MIELKISDSVSIDAQKVVAERGCIIGQSGSGKSYLAAVLAEELCRNHIPFVVVDTEGEYFSLKSMFEIIWVGKNPKADLNIDTDFSILFSNSIENGIPVILDVSDELDKKAVVFNALRQLYSIEDKKHMPYLVVVEEADMFVPQVIEKAPNILDEISVRGRKRGIGLLVATQRPAKISKNILSQCSYGFIGRLTIENDLEAVSILFEDRRRLVELTSIEKGNFISFGLGLEGPIKVRARLTEHVSTTPEVKSYDNAPVLDSIIKAIKGNVKKTENEKKDKSGETNIEIIPNSFSASDIKELADKKAKHSLFIIGRKEKVEAIKKKFLQIEKFKIYIPLKKAGTYKEAYALISSLSFFSITNKLKICKCNYKRDLSEEEEKIAKALFLRKKAQLFELQIDSGIDASKVEKAISSFSELGLAQDKGKFIYFVSKERCLISNDIQSQKIVVSQDTLLKDPTEALSEKLVLQQFPGAVIKDKKVLYLNLYEITYRDLDKIRISTIAVFGKYYDFYEPASI
ncbi:MAG: ATP-binding protein [Candidatus Micrarchaeia archaeon]